MTRLQNAGIEEDLMDFATMWTLLKSDLEKFSRIFNMLCLPPDRYGSYCQKT